MVERSGLPVMPLPHMLGTFKSTQGNLMEQWELSWPCLAQAGTGAPNEEAGDGGNDT